MNGRLPGRPFIMRAVIDDFIAETEARWDELARGQAAIRADADSRAVDRRWSQGTWGERLQPYFNERFEFSPLRLRRRRPEDVEGWTEYGFDAQRRCVLVRQHAFGRSYQDEVLTYGDEHVERLHFHWVQDWAREPGDQEYKLVGREVLVGADRPAFWAQLVRRDRYDTVETRVGWEEYRYRRDGRLGEVVESQPIYEAEQGFGDLRVGDVAVSRDVFDYDDSGDLVTIRRHGPLGAPGVVWRRRPASLKPALRLVEDTLVAEIAVWARDHWPSEPAFSLVLGYTAGHPLSLFPGIGTERERRQALAEPDEYGVGVWLWNPVEYEHAPEFAPAAGDAEFAEAVALLEQEWRMTDDAAAGFKLLARVAKRLNADGLEELPRTDDFVVVAMDPQVPDQAHVERHHRACIAKERFQDLKRRGLFYVDP